MPPWLDGENGETPDDPWQAALDWLADLHYDFAHGLAIAPGEPGAERTDYAEVVLADRLRGLPRYG